MIVILKKGLMMLCDFIFDDIKKRVLLSVLLVQSLVVYAGSTESAAPMPVSDADAVFQSQQSGSSFPAWPLRQQVNNTIVPPPPPGPYMSLGLNDFPVGEPAFARNQPASASAVPIDVFSPDIPWPKNLRPPKRWMPEEGYHYVELRPKPSLQVNTYPLVQNNLPYNYHYGYQKPPVMMPDQRRMPSMGAGSERSYPAVIPADYDPAYANPVNGNPRRQGNTTYNSSFPVSGR